jgi:predicted nucleic acid-binding protein
MPVLDTNFLIALDAKDPPALGLLEELRQEPLLVPSVVAAEFLTMKADPAAAFDSLEAAFTVVQTSRAWTVEAASWRRELRSARIPARSADAWIACWARLHKTFVVTRNAKEFQRLGVEVRSW